MSGAEKGIEAIDNYEVALASKSENDLLFYLNQGDQLMMSSVQDHDQAVVLYNDYSGVSEALMLRNGLIVGSIISILFSVILFFKARIHPGIQAEMIRANIYKGLFQSSAWMTAGILITTISYLFVFEKGGTYLIFYGPVLVGGWQLLRGLSKYFTKDRKVLKELSRAERESIIKQTYEKPGEEEEIIDVGKKCPHCDNPIPSKAIICPNCGKNVL